MIKHIKIITTITIFCMFCAFSIGRHYERNTKLQHRFYSINDRIATKSIYSFNANNKSYLILPLEDAEVIHLLGHMTGHDCFVEIGHVADRRFFERQQYDSIYQFMESWNYEIPDSNLSKWLNIQKKYIDFYKGDHMNYIQFIEEYENWPDSITDEQLRDQLLNEGGDWKDCYDPAYVSWLSLPDSLDNVINQLLNDFPKSRYLRYKLERDSIDNNYYDLEGILTK